LILLENPLCNAIACAATAILAVAVDKCFVLKHSFLCFKIIYFILYYTTTTQKFRLYAEYTQYIRLQYTLPLPHTTLLSISSNMYGTCNVILQILTVLFSLN
jgi:hypothetical protein